MQCYIKTIIMYILKNLFSINYSDWKKSLKSVEMMLCRILNVVNKSVCSLRASRVSSLSLVSLNVNVNRPY